MLTKAQTVKFVRPPVTISLVMLWYIENIDIVIESYRMGRLNVDTCNVVRPTPNF